MILDQSPARKVVVVTGGAQGLGAAIVKELAQAEYQVIIADVQQGKAQQLTETLNQSGYKVMCLPVDLSQTDSIISMLNQVFSSFGRLDVVINNAGTDVTKPIQEMTVEEWDRVLMVNLRGAFIMSKYSLDKMSNQGSGHIVNIASTAAKRAWKNASAYHASKWGLLGFTYALFTEAREYNVKVSAIVAGGMKTPFILDRFPDVDPSSLQDPQNVAKVIRFVLEQPVESVIPEVMVIPIKETSWP